MELSFPSLTKSNRERIQPLNDLSSQCARTYLSPFEVVKPSTVPRGLRSSSDMIAAILIPLSCRRSRMRGVLHDRHLSAPFGTFQVSTTSFTERTQNPRILILAYERVSE